MPQVAGLLQRQGALRQALAEGTVVHHVGASRAASVTRARSLFSNHAPAPTPGPADADAAVRPGSPNQPPAAPGSSPEAGVAAATPPLTALPVEALAEEYAWVAGAVASASQALATQGGLQRLHGTLDGVRRRAWGEARRAGQLRERAARLRQSVGAVGEGAQAAGAWARTLQDRQDLSQASGYSFN